LITMIVNVSGGHAFIALVLTMICCIILGMGVPTTANYCIMAATCAPILMSKAIGIEKVCAHFFVFYFGIVADITPPVALAAYAGSAIAKASPMKTAFNATKLAIGAFIVPYIFAFSPVMLFVNVQSVLEIVLICLTALLGIFGVAASLNGYLFAPMNVILRLIICAGGLSMLVPGIASDLAGLVLVGFVAIVQYIKTKK
ncbi:MAG: TRAP transporter large permease subunit, partial [Synergistaceae bacterium]|nr:TRAP transporter large permease subunit [Synergistaceae bacterium]